MTVVELVSLFDGVAERFCVIPNSTVTCGDSNQRWRFAKQLECRQMQRIERANRFDGKRAASASEDRVGHGNQVAATLKSTERLDRRSFLLGRQPCRRPRTQNRSGDFGDCQRGRDLTSSRADRLQRVRVTFQQRRGQRARLDVSKTNRISARSRRLGATLRHDRRRLVRRQFPPEGVYPATLPSGRRLRAAGVSLRRRRARRSGSAWPSSLSLAGQALRPRGRVR